MENGLEPRIALGQFVPNVNASGTYEVQWFPPGFIYEDILEFLLEVFRMAYRGRQGRDVKGEPIKNPPSDMLTLAK